MNPRTRFVHEDGSDKEIPLFLPAHLEYLQARFGNFKQTQSPQSVNDLISISSAASEQIGANKLLAHISALIAGNATDKGPAVLNAGGAAFTDTTKTS